ncbi:hypothetical protein HED50_08030 [Ochrobactrum oryzae]|nr:hypothetical protein [Brucella oryzae]
MFVYSSARFWGLYPTRARAITRASALAKSMEKWGMAEVDPLSRDADIDIGALFSSLRRHWLFIVVGALIMAAAAWAICLF